MENQTELKWHQKPISIILLFIFFFPLGLYFMWKNELWNKKIRWIITGIAILLVIANFGNQGNQIKGEWFCTRDFSEASTIHILFTPNSDSNSGTVSVWEIYRTESAKSCTCEGEYKVLDDNSVQISGVFNRNCSYLSQLNGTYKYSTKYNEDAGMDDLNLTSSQVELQKYKDF